MFYGTVGQTIDSILNRCLPVDTRDAAIHAVLRMETDNVYRKRVQFIGGDVSGAFLWDKTDESYDFWLLVSIAPNKATTFKEAHYVNS